MKRVVITGMGIYSCLGTNLDEVKNSLYSAKSGIGIDPKRKEIGFRSSLTGLLERPQLKGVLPRRSRIGLAEQGEYAYVATVEALDKAGIDQEYLEKNEAGILYGNDSSAKAVIDSVDTIREKQDTQLVGSAAVFQGMNSTVTMNLAVIFKLRGINYTISAACASGSHAIGQAYFMIKHGLQEMIICGGAQEVNAFSMGSFDALGAFSVRESAPSEASRPFDKDRDGLVPSGGAASLILETYESAKKRGAKIYGEIIGYGFSSNGEHISVPNVAGPVQSLKMALKDARLSPEKIDYINAHATSTPVGDKNEAEALSTVFNSHKPFVSSTKSLTGHECWMAGASEIVYSSIMMENAFITKNLNFNEPDESSVKLKIAQETIDTNIDYYLSNSFGFGGTNATLIVKKI